MKHSNVHRVRNRVAAVAALGLMMVTGLASASQASEVECRSSGFECTRGGYSAADTPYVWVDNYYGNNWGSYAPGGHNCTRYAAFRLAANGLADPGSSFGDAGDWAGSVAAQYGAGAVTDVPAVGSIAQWNRNAGMGADGHVAYVEEVSSGSILITEDNHSGSTRQVRLYPGEAGWPSNFLHLADLASFVPAAGPEISGTGIVDSPLTAVIGTWVPTPTSITYGWYRDGVTLVGSAETYTPTQADIGHDITLAVAGRKAGYLDKTRASAPLPITTAGSFAFSGAPAAISGTSQVDSTLLATSGITTTGVTTAITWLRDGAVRQTGGNTLLLTAADIGSSITVQYRYTKPGYETRVFTSQAVTVSGYSTYSFSGSPASISGTAKVEYTLSTSSGLQTAGVTTTVTWLKNGAVRQNGGSTLVLYASDIGASISVQYTFSKPGYQTLTYTSAAVAIAGYSAFSFSGAPAALSGTAKVEYTLTASSGLTTAGATSSITWLRNGAVRQSGGSTLALTAADIGTSITVRFTYDKQGYASSSYTSPAVAVAGYSSYSFSGAPAAISGTAKVGNTLQAVSGLQTAGVTRTYQWFRNGVARTTGSTYTLTSADKGAKITVRITFDKQGYAAMSSTSTAVTVS